MKRLSIYWGQSSCCICPDEATVTLWEDGHPRNTYCDKHAPTVGIPTDRNPS